MKMQDAIEKLESMKDAELHQLATEFEIRFETESGTVNKGWAGQVCESILGLSPNSRRNPDFEDWELKVVPVKKNSSGSWAYKETMAITMIDPEHIKQNSFESSHLLHKLRKFLLVIREVGETAFDESYIIKATAVELSEETYAIVSNDYNTVKECICDPTRGFSQLTGKMGHYVQPRTKGAGHGSTSRAFYARQRFLNQVAPLPVN